MKPRLFCIECGAKAEAACDCGVSYVPASARAEKVAAEHPALSIRATAEKAGVGRGTAARAKARVPFGTPEVIGRDGKRYSRASKRPRIKVSRHVAKVEQLGLCQEAIDRQRDLVIGPKANPQKIAEAIFKSMPEKADRIATALFALVNKAKKVPQLSGDEMGRDQFDSTPDLSVCADARDNPADLSIPPFLKRSAGAT